MKTAVFRALTGSVEVTPEWNQHLECSLRLIQKESPLSGIDPGVAQTLREFHDSDRIYFTPSLKGLARYNGLLGVIQLNPNSLHFLNHDFEHQKRTLGTVCCSRLMGGIEDLHMHALFQLSGILIHEGQHAFRPIRSLLSPKRAMAEDEQAAFEAEQLWYRHLSRVFDSRYLPELARLGQAAEYDAASAQDYLRLNIVAPTQLES